MPHSLRAKLSGLHYKGILEDKDYKRLCHALDLEKAEQEPITTTNNNEPITIIYPTIVCDDAISREAVMGLVAREHTEWDDLYIDIAKLPSVTQKSGKWITQWNAAHQKEYYYCSECREEFSYDGETGIKMNDYDFCPNCGAKMVEPQESEDKE